MLLALDAVAVSTMVIRQLHLRHFNMGNLIQKEATLTNGCVNSYI